MDVPASLSVSLSAYLPAACRCACVWPCEPIGEMDVWERAGGRPESRFGDALRLQLVVVLRASEKGESEIYEWPSAPLRRPP